MKRITTKAFLLATAIATFASGAVLAEEFNLDALIEAARAEPAINVYDSTGKIVEMAEKFTAMYGVEAIGTKIKAPAALEMIIREAQAGNVQADVSIISDVPAAMAQLIPQGFAESWVSPALAEHIPSEAQNPLLVVSSANIIAYNTTLYDTCPLTNIWQLTEEEWSGRFAMQDPLGKPSYTDWFNQMRTYADDKVRAAYEAQYGKPLETEYDSATEAFVAALAANGPLLTDSDSAAAEAVAAPGQTEPFLGLVASAKFRDNAGAGFSLGLCKGVDPIIGFMNSGAGLMMTGSDSPNASKLFLHYVMTAEGIAPQSADGKMSSNRSVALPDDEPSGIGEYVDQVLAYNPARGEDDWDTRQDWQDFWRVNYAR